MANRLYQQLANGKTDQDDMKGVISALKSSNNPQQLLASLATRNTAVANVLRDVQANGGDAKSLFFSRAQQMGIDPNRILDELR